MGVPERPGKGIFVTIQLFLITLPMLVFPVRGFWFLHDIHRGQRPAV
jgi:hypothetical protein